MTKRVLATFVMICAGCQVYPQWAGEFDAGPVDPANFPPPYLGTGANPAKPGSGKFQEVYAYAGDTQIAYFAFPFATTITASTASTPPNPLLLQSNGVPSTIIPAPPALVFDPQPQSGNPFPAAQTCEAPAGYVYDERLSDVDDSQQGNIFTALPTATLAAGKAVSWSYEPIVSEVVMHAAGIPCQSDKSQATALAASGGQAPATDLNFLAWPIIDPAAAVFRANPALNNPANVGITAQHWGWYEHYLVAYLDGGYIQTVAPQGTGNILMVAQNLYYPRSEIVPTTGSASPGKLGAGYDVLDQPRSAGAAYSPICQVWSYDVGGPTTVSALPQDSQTIVANYSATFVAGNPPYIFCLQVQ